MTDTYRRLRWATVLNRNGQELSEDVHVLGRPLTADEVAANKRAIDDGPGRYHYLTRGGLLLVSGQRYDESADQYEARDVAAADAAISDARR